MNIIQKIAEDLSLKKMQVEAAVQLLDEGNTVPFIARYRKEATHGLNDEELRSLEEKLQYLRNLEERRESILNSIAEQGKLTEELKAQIEAADTAVRLEDLYLPYKKKRRTRGMIAREKGLEGLAKAILTPGVNPVKEAEKYLSEEKEVCSVEEALNYAKDILAEEFSENASYREWIRNKTMELGSISSSKKETEENPDAKTYEMYFDYEEKVKTIPGYRTLAINRGEKEKVLSVKLNFPQEEILAYLEKQAGKALQGENLRLLQEAVQDSFKRLISPSIETEIRNILTEKAEDGAIAIFADNLKQLLMQAPIVGKVVLGWDPGFRTGCKIAVVDPTGKVLDTTVIYPTPPKNQVKEAMAAIHKLIEKHKVDIIALGNGTASRESEKVISDYIHETKSKVQYVIVNEAGASVYSASKLATEEFPNFDTGERSSTSMARRLQDPLAELVKIEPKAIGVGQYQHDMNQNKLEEQLNNTVEDCVNHVGVDLNTASAALLSYISGINKTLAKNIVVYREENGAFKSRKELLKVAKLGPKAFEQSAGFLRIREGKEVLDRTSVHPESYQKTKELLSLLNLNEKDIAEGKGKDIAKMISALPGGMKALEEKLAIGSFTLKDIVEALAKPGRDPREDVPAPILRSDVLELSDLKEGMILEGTVRNVLDFGAFVDIGVHQDGLVHISALSKKFVKHPLDVVKLGDIVKVKILSVDMERKKISLSMKDAE
ncbi:competence protein ComEA helix-hairpin-helix repeat region [Oribacterium parvum ACB1]|uniref:Competence protein ComEA helix-hairpin-helix repeat region n=2 Tax=Oribacterium parvum TaxID=1501329 RepID=G9WKJ5_9FIRM|nr:Tex family protein [Oribacterium parvum]EHL13837.1 competence protein ComEA helix-hairpin-helix repeat region [Oribacterium parvum ACB1]EJF13085.1 Tex-like protein N-terminal domain protein [Oribacterium parvum ACB8]